MTYSLEVENFIFEVKKHPILWLSTEESKSKDRKNEAWGEVASVFVKDYEQKQYVEKIDICKKLNSKWRNIRDTYVRTLRNPNRQYMYGKHLTFLEERYKAGLEDESQSEDDDVPIKREVNKRRFEDSIWSDRNEMFTKRNNYAIEYVNSEALNEPTVNFNRTHEDDDRSFFDSLLPAVRQLNIDQKLEFRSEVLALLKQIRTGNRI